MRSQLLLFSCAALLALAAGCRNAVTPADNAGEIMKQRRDTMRNVRDFGAVGDGVTKDTAAIQKAIDAGGVVRFPPGVYLSGTLYLKSNGGLHLEPGAVLKASPDKEDYNADDFCPQNRVFKSEYSSGAHFIVALEQRNIVLSGTGIIDGNRPAFYGLNEEPDCKAHIDEHFSSEELINGWRPSQMLFFCECRDVTVQDVKLYNSPQWNCFFHGCQDVFVRGVRILNDQRTFNGDGIDIDCCQRVTVSDCIIDSGDDSITLRGSEAPLKTKRPCEHITVTNCILHTRCCAIRVGVGTGIVRKAVFSNIVVHDTRTAVCIVSNYGTDPEGGVGIEDISFENFRVDCVRPFGIYSYVRGPGEFSAKRMIRCLRFRNFTGTFSRPSQICGSQGKGVEDLSFADIRLKCIGNTLPLTTDYEAPGYGEWEKAAPAAAFYVAYAENIDFFRVRVDWNGHDDWKHGLVTVHAKNVTQESCDFGKENFAVKK